jgi:hypothetical protein
VLRQELKHVATTRATAQVKATAEAQITGAERVLIRALASATEMQASGVRTSARDGAEEEFDPARQAQYALQSERLYEGLASQSLMEALLEAGTEAADVLALPKTEDDRRLLASILMSEEEELTPETVEGAVRAAAGASAAWIAASRAPAGGTAGAFARKGAFEASFDGSRPGRGERLERNRAERHLKN